VGLTRKLGAISKTVSEISFDAGEALLEAGDLSSKISRLGAKRHAVEGLLDRADSLFEPFHCRSQRLVLVIEPIELLVEAVEIRKYLVPQRMDSRVVNVKAPEALATAAPSKTRPLSAESEKILGDGPPATTALVARPFGDPALAEVEKPAPGQRPVSLSTASR
jgi:hypothetical protein